MVKSDDSGSAYCSNSDLQEIPTPRKPSEKRRARNRHKNKRNRANSAYFQRKKQRDKKRRNAKRNKRINANHEYKARLNAKKHERDKAKAEYQEKKMSRLNRKKNAKKQTRRATYSIKVVEYERILKNGHDRVCVYCGQLFAEIGIVVNLQQCISAVEKDTELIVVRQIGLIPDLQLYITCSNAVAKGKVPKLCLGNGLDLPQISD